MNLPLKFCISCGRAITGKESGRMGGMKALSKGGVTKKLDDAKTTGDYDRARRSYGFEQAVRQFLRSFLYIGGFALLYFVAVAYVMQDPKVAAMFHRLISPAPPPQPAAEIKPAFQSQTAPSPQDTSTALPVKHPIRHKHQHRHH